MNGGVFDFFFSLGVLCFIAFVYSVGFFLFGVNASWVVFEQVYIF